MSLERRIAHRALPAVLIALLACASAGVQAGGRVPSLARDDRRLVSSYTDIRGVAVSRRYVFAAAPDGVAVFDRLLNAWQPPVSITDGTGLPSISVMAGDPFEDAAWVGVPGAVLLVRPQMEQVQATMLTGVPDVIVFDRLAGGDAWVRASGQWTRVSRSGIATPVAGPPPADQRVTTPSLSDMAARFPALRTLTPLAHASALRPLRNAPIVSAAGAPDQPSEIWLGTAGDGLYRVDGVTVRATPMRFGLLERGVGAVARAADGVWAAGLGRALDRGGLTFASADLQQWRWLAGTLAVPMRGVRAGVLAVRGPRAWIGTDRGLVRARLDASEAFDAWTTLDGLPDDRVLAVAARDDGAWVGTARGLVFVSDTAARSARTRGVASLLLENTPVYALQQMGDTLWIGTADGLLARLPSGALARPAGGDPLQRQRILAMAWSDSVLLAATTQGVLAVSPRGTHAPQRVTALDGLTIGPVSHMAMDDRTVAFAGSDGLALWARGGAVRVLRVPEELPAPPLDVAMDATWLWVATPAGLVRLRRAADGGVW